MRVLTVASVIGLVAMTATGCGDASRATAPPPVVKVEPVVERDVPISVEYVGTLVGSINAQIRARVAGHLVSQNYSEGSPVKAGDLLFQVDARPFQTAADQADAKLQLAESQLSQAKAQVGASQAQVEQAIAKVAQDEAQVKRAEATQRQTELDVNRYTPLAQRGSVSQQELDNAVQSNRPTWRRWRPHACARVARGCPAQPRLHQGVVADRRRSRIPRGEHRRLRRPD